MKIFIGTTNIANQIVSFSTILRRLGYDTITEGYKQLLRFFPDQAFSYDLSTFPTLEGRFNLLRNVVDECDLFFYMWPKQAIVSPEIDFSCIKASGKPLVIMFVGDDARVRRVFNQIMRYRRKGDYHDLEVTESVDLENLKTLKTVEKYADIILSSDELSIFSQRPFHRWALPVDLHEFHNYTPIANVHPRIAIVPSNFKTKGIGTFVDSLPSLYASGESFTLEMLANVPESSLLDLFSRSDIFFEQVGFPVYGKSAVQAMALGAIPITSCDETLSPFPRFRPTLRATPSTLNEVILEYVRKPFAERQQIQANLITYIHEKHDGEKVFRGLFEILNGRSSKHFELAENSAFKPILSQMQLDGPLC